MSYIADLFPKDFAPFTASIEDREGHSFQHGYHLGTDERVARQVVEDIFNNRVKHGQPVVTVALKRAGNIVDVFGGTWHNDDMDQFWDESSYDEDMDARINDANVSDVIRNPAS